MTAQIVAGNKAEGVLYRIQGLGEGIVAPAAGDEKFDP